MKRLTPAMKRKLVPYLPKLIRGWRQLAKGGVDPSEGCPLCVASRHTRGGDDDCRHCPVFSTVARHFASIDCCRYLPAGAWDGGEPAQRVLDFLIRLQKKAAEGKVTL